MNHVMHSLDSSRHSRRAFLRRSAHLAFAGTALPTALNLAAMGEAAAFNANDYKALVCVFLYGGNDYANTVVAYDDPNYLRYQTIRGSIALSKASLGNTLLQPATPLPDGRQYALNPTMTGLAGLFNAGKAAVQLNVGPLVMPLTRAQYNNPDRWRYPLPPQLFSHNDQQSIWQSSSPEGATTGWGGKLGDLASASNNASSFTCISVSGNAVFLSGQSVSQCQVNAGGVVGIKGIKASVYGSSAVQGTLSTLIQQPRSHALENLYTAMTARSIRADATMSGALAGTTLSTTFPSGNSLAEQLKTVARLIATRNTLGNKRQVFFVSIGGFDLHSNLISRHGPLLGQVSDAMTAFYNATVELGVSDKVTTFTASDFGRTLSSNGDGSDHGWGSHHLVVGGAVSGGAFYGKPPPISTGNTGAPEDQWHVGQGRLLPTTSVDQYAATLATWFGVEAGELNAILPNLRHFGAAAGRTDYPSNMGFMAA